MSHISPRLTWLIAGCLVLILAAALPALGDSLQLTGANPAGTVYLYGSALPSPYNDTNGSTKVDAYAGVLDWNDLTNNGKVYTYCVDVGAIININGKYTFESAQPIGSATVYNTTTPLFDAAQLNGLYNLWNDSRFGNAATTGGTSFNPSGISPTNAAMFQVAIWDILYNEGSATATGNTALNFTNPGSGLGDIDPYTNHTRLQDALNFASQDYAATVDPTKIPAIQALVATDGSQNQAIYLGGFLPPPPTPAPLPAAANAGLALLGCVGLGAWMRRRRIA